MFAKFNKGISDFAEGISDFANEAAGGGSRSHSSRTETRTVTGSDGITRTETKTLESGGGGGGMKFGFMDGGGFNAGFGGLGSVTLGGKGSNFLKFHRSTPVQGRYSKGWGSRREHRPAPGPPMELEGKTYEEIREQCIKEGRLFEDPDFPAEDASIFYSKKPPRPFVWKRPPELCGNPQLFVEGASRFDVKQGELGDCWLLAAVASLCQNKTLLYRVVPPEQGFTDGYAGIFHFQFWQYGEWKDIVVDDRLPTYYNKLVFMHSEANNEFWTPLLEKAYAKLCGSYESLKGGATSEAMEDFTGGVTEMFDFRENIPANMFQIMFKANERGSLMGCSIEGRPGEIEAELSNGLIMGHAYSVTGVSLVEIQTSRMKGKIPMVRVRNPWGNECEWKGAWSDSSQEWKFISAEERQKIGLTFDDDGEFWMAFNDFKSNFQKIEICNLGPDSPHEEQSSKKRWESTVLEGSWRKRVNAGGCRNYLESFWTNPQYRVEVVDPDDDDEDNMGTIICGLMQKERRKLRKEGVDLLTMGYVIYKLKDASAGPLDMRFFKYNASVAKSPNFINLREVCGRHKLPPGTYCIIPSTFEPQMEGDFLLRVFSEKPNISNEMDEETSISDVQKRTWKEAWGEPEADSESEPLTPSEPPEPNPTTNGDSHPDNQSDNGGEADKVVHVRGSDGKRRRYVSSFFPREFFHEMPARFRGLFQTPTEVEVEEAGMAPVEEATLTATHVMEEGGYSVLPFNSSRVATVLPFPEQELSEEDKSQDKELRGAFKKIAGEDMEIDAYELKEIINAAFMKEFKFGGFGDETARSMVAMMDLDRSGKLGYDEFKKLWNDLRLWKSVFKQFDKDKSGMFNAFELRQAFHSMGFRISNSTFNALVQRYSHRDGKIHFDDFIHCTVRLKTMFDIFRETDEKNTGKATFGLDEFIQTTMYS